MGLSQMTIKVNNIAFVMLVLGITLLVPAVNLYAGWQEPKEVITESWGSGPGQFGIEYGDTVDKFPTSIGISSSGRIVIADSINEVLHIFKVDGSFYKDVQKPVQRKWWPYAVIVNGECAVVGYAEFTHTFNTITGDLIGTAQNMGGAKYVSADCTKIYIGGLYKSGENWKVYSPAGQLIKTSATKPLELGVIKEQRLGEKSYVISVSYPEYSYSLNLTGPYEKYERDMDGFINALSGKAVKRFDHCGKELGALSMPEDQHQLIRPGGQGLDALYDLIAEYGQPVIAPNGDVYTWKRTPDNYSILKWTWVDDPNVPTGPDAPTGLSVAASINGLYLTWTASPQDPGCVTGYEVVRATSAGGVFSTVATVEKSVVKYNDTSAEAGTTYYYKVRAKAGTEYSPYTSPVSGKR